MKRIMGQDDISRINCTSVLNLIRKHKGMTRRQLETATGLSWGGVSNTVSRLTGAGYLTERKESGSGGSGRTPVILEICGDDNLTLGIDVNDTGLTACVMNLKNEILGEFAAPADYSSPDALISGLTALIKRALASYKAKRFLAAGVSMQGEVDGVNGVSVRLPQCPGWEFVPLKEILEEKLSLDFVIGHDPDCMLSTYLTDGEQKNLLLLRLDRSVGMAAALRGEILYGSGLWEIAHMSVDPEGPVCRCGRRGCLEAYVSACRIGQNTDREALKRLSAPLASAARNLIHMFRPDRLFLCGELMKYKDAFYPAFFEEIQRNGTNGIPDILTAADAKAAMKGAAMLAADHALRQLEL